MTPDHNPDGRGRHGPCNVPRSIRARDYLRIVSEVARVDLPGGAQNGESQIACVVPVYHGATHLGDVTEPKSLAHSQVVALVHRLYLLMSRVTVACAVLFSYAHVTHFPVPCSVQASMLRCPRSCVKGLVFKLVVGSLRLDQQL